MSTGAAAVAPPSEPMVPTAYRVLESRREVEPSGSGGTGGVVTLGLEAVGDGLAAPAPGQFYMAWAPAVGEVPISVSGFRDGVVELTIAAVGATTAALCAAEVGSTLGLRGPFGRGWSPTDPAEPLVVVAGGLGLAPLRMFVLTEIERRAREGGGPVTLVVGARSPAEIIFAGELERLTELAELALTVDRAERGWSGGVGLVTEPLRRISPDPSASARLCGPEVMMRVVARSLVDAGLDPERIEVSLERSMACAVAHCGRCQLGPVMLCRDGPVLAWSEAAALMEVRRW